jgi:hypothetical protein
LYAQRIDAAADLVDAVLMASSLDQASRAADHTASFCQCFV